jgi:hypothetical protein
LQKQLKNVVKADLEFRNTRNGIRVITKGMADFEAVKSYISNNNLSYFSFFPKSQKPIKAIMRHLPPDTPAEDICEGLVNLGFDVLSVKQMTTTRRSSSDETATTRNLHLFLVTLPMTAKSQEIFHLPSLCHISIRVEAYRAQTGLTQCHNCQQFGNVWSKCKQLPRCLWCGSGHLHKECLEMGNPASTPSMLQLPVSGGRESSSRQLSRLQTCQRRTTKRKAHRTLKTTTGRVFSSNRITPGVSFAAALRGSAEQQQKPQANQVPVTSPPAAGIKYIPASALQQETG